MEKVSDKTLVLNEILPEPVADSHSCLVSRAVKEKIASHGGPVARHAAHGRALANLRAS